MTDSLHGEPSTGREIGCPSCGNSRWDCLPGKIQSIAERIKSLRLEKKWTQKELGKKAGLQQEAIARLEAGHPFSVRTLIRLAVALDKTLELL